jgi:hypothetical protein
VAVRILQSWNDGGAAGIDHACGRTARREHVIVAAHGDDDSAAHRHGACSGARGVDGVDRRVVQDEVGRRRALRSERRGRPCCDSDRAGRV